MVAGVEREDVISVAESLNLTLTEEQISKVLHMYSHEEECDPNANWTLIVEHCINQVCN